MSSQSRINKVGYVGFRVDEDDEKRKAGEVTTRKMTDEEKKKYGGPSTIKRKQPFLLGKWGRKKIVR